MRVLGQGILTRILHILLQITATVLVGNLGKVKIKILSVTNAKILNSVTGFTRSLEDGSANDPTTVESPPQDHFEMPGCFPDYEPVSMPSSVYWGRKSDGAEIWLNTTSNANAYNEVTNRRKNTFLVPYGKIGRHFIDQVAKHINDWNNKSEMHHIALTAAIVLLASAL